MASKATKQERADSMAMLRKFVKPGATVYCRLRHVAASGMSRRISLYVHDGERMVWLDGYACTALGWRRYHGSHDAIVVSGCGMDMGFHLVSELSAVLFRDGFGCTGERCPSNDHSNGDRSYAPHSEEAPHWHSSAGYALRHEWL